ncbi:hypothetical protein Y032_0116g601 [Ancylostoma ceylanicum]|uniref:Uncharacterized protein n=1 Tax=Ancylostoma ceylanicum TaxID=53326 RepID=A0A016TCN3_9BILA|nr:hypothetical protein Y032_0116g601 [Ancylostoma ceylanicum]
MVSGDDHHFGHFPSSLEFLPHDHFFDHAAYPVPLRVRVNRKKLASKKAGKACLATIASRGDHNLSIFAHTSLGCAVPVIKLWQLSRTMASRTRHAHAMLGRRDAPISLASQK